MKIKGLIVLLFIGNCAMALRYVESTNFGDHRHQKIERLSKKNFIPIRQCHDNQENKKEVRRNRSGFSINFIGCPPVGATLLPKTMIEEISVKTGSISAQYENKEKFMLFSRNIFCPQFSFPDALKQRKTTRMLSRISVTP